MLDTLNSSKLEAERAAVLNELFTRAVGGDLEAQTELSGIAFGQPGLARDLCQKMDAVIAGAVPHGITTAIEEIK